MDKSLRPYMAELVGTFAFVFLSAGAICVNQIAAMSWPQPSELTVTAAQVLQPRGGLIGIALATGLVYAVALAFTLPLSGGYLNPAVPLALWVFKRLDGKTTTWLIAAQLLGAALAGLVVRIVLGFNDEALTAAHLGTPHLNLDAFGAASVGAGTILRGVAIELVLTFLLVFAIFGITLDPRSSRKTSGWLTRLAPLWLGITVAVATLVGFTLTGAAMNPARWFGTVVWEATVVALSTQGPLRDHAVYWIGPIVGALIAVGLYGTLILPLDGEDRLAHETPAPTAKPAPVSSTLFRARK